MEWGLPLLIVVFLAAIGHALTKDLGRSADFLGEDEPRPWDEVLERLVRRDR